MARIRVAMADDHTLVRRSIISVLSTYDDLDFVADASNGFELCEMIYKLSSPPDVCLLDVNMPVMNGYDTLVTLKSKYPEMRFLMLTQYDNEFVIIKMLKSGANAYMLKNTEPLDLVIAIRTIIEKPFFHSNLVNGHLIAIVQKEEEYSKLSLSDLEKTFLTYTASELTYKEIASKMNLSVRTIEGYREKLFLKLEVKSRTGLALYAIRLGLIMIESSDQNH